MHLLAVAPQHALVREGLPALPAEILLEVQVRHPEVESHGRFGRKGLRTALVLTGHHHLSMDHGLVMVQLVPLLGDEVALIARVCLGMLLSSVTDHVQKAAENLLPAGALVGLAFGPFKAFPRMLGQDVFLQGLAGTFPAPLRSRHGPHGPHAQWPNAAAASPSCGSGARRQCSSGRCAHAFRCATSATASW